MKFPYAIYYAPIMSYTIPRTLWESLDAVLFTKGLALAKEIAADLALPAQPLIAALNTQERSKFIILPDDEATTYQCQALIKNGATFMRCRCPTMRPAPSYCGAHERYNPDIPRGLRQIRLVEGSDVPYVLYGSDIFTLNGEKCGYRKGRKVTLFEIEK
jgi:hypothetical protein